MFAGSACYQYRRATGEAIVGVLRISVRRVDRVKKGIVEASLEAALGSRQGRRAKYLRKADGEFDARLVALSCGDPTEGHAQWSLRLLAEREGFEPSKGYQPLLP